MCRQSNARCVLTTYKFYHCFGYMKLTKFPSADVTTSNQKSTNEEIEKILSRIFTRSLLIHTVLSYNLYRHFGIQSKIFHFKCMHVSSFIKKWNDTNRKKKHTTNRKNIQQRENVIEMERERKKKEKQENQLK